MSSKGRNRRIREFKLRKLFVVGYKAGEAVAENGGTLNDCPYGVCEEASFEGHKNSRIAGFGFGYFEVLIEREIALYKDLAFDAMVAVALQERIPPVITPKNPRSKEAFLTRFKELIGPDFAADVVFEWV